MRAPVGLGLDAVAAAITGNAWHPVDRYGRLSMASFVAGWAVSEMPVPVLGAIAAGNGAAFATGRLRGPAGRLALVTAASSAATLLTMEAVAKRAGDCYEQALVDALGATYRDAVVHPDFPGADVAPMKPAGLIRTARIRRRFAHHRDISYGPAGGANLLDVWSREDLPRDGAAPVLVQMPGGAWVMGNKQAQAYPLMSHLADRGWICVAISYRLGPRNTWPAQIADVKRAIAWIKANIGRYGGDPSFVAVTGGSAGGHLSALAALTANDPAFQPGFEDADTTVQAAAPFYGAYDFVDEDRVGNRGVPPFVEKHVFKTTRAADRALFEAASPMHRMHADAPPFLLAHGTNDSLIPVEQGRLFAHRLAAVSRNPVAWVELPRAQHAFDIFGSARSNAAAEATGRFLGQVYGQHRAAR